MIDFGIYIIITKPQLPYTTIAEKCVIKGIKMLQLREKHLSDKELIRIGRDIKSITTGSETKFVVNDRPDLAVLCDADYLHLGQDDISIEDARRIVGDMKIGLSTHSIAQATEALAKNPDYIGFGPIFPTNAKAIPDKPVGTNQLKQVLEISKVPVVAIGGIFPENIEEVIGVGAKSIALVRNFMQTNEFDARVSEINKLLNRTK
ncbi:MAG TPA: thiamine phosphate synthase [Tenuifilaceae bacterium]|nr:thiamine phosphate synthase [Tenuifilaceae bacterium]HOZ15779.1 thiamine phosphate synthase [Tenuifilaceae bacterium]HPI45080.1 thiamine phosphate synthase [Tenuifilaceae bacterium]HPN22897.1 thiamine phosphate synthase [Tenuifilaceae bacterium]HPV56275.1 thiamine phosphate synthase [Tenuifilaceae bacterium]